MESFAHFRYFLSNTPNLPERNLAHELYLRGGQGQTLSARKKDDVNTCFNEEQVNSPVEGGVGPSGRDFKDDVEGGGDRGDDKKEEDYQGSEHEPRAQERARIAQGMNESERDEQSDSKEQQDQL